MSPLKANDNRRNPWTHVLVACCAAFIFTVFLMVAAAFRGRGAPLSRFFDRHGLLVLGIEVAVILSVTLVVMVMERRETRRQLDERERLLLLDEEEKAPSEELKSR
jgi:hypothetical protein